MSMTNVTRYVGFCPICEGDFKLVPKAGRISGDKVSEHALVHHGYRRPGTGSIHVDCFAVGWLPYELSKEVCERWRDRRQAQLDAATETLRMLQDPALASLRINIVLLFAGPLREEDVRERRFGQRHRDPYDRL